jgi:hypothetical protein
VPFAIGLPDAWPFLREDSSLERSDGLSSIRRKAADSVDLDFYTICPAADQERLRRGLQKPRYPTHPRDALINGTPHFLGGWRVNAGRPSSPNDASYRLAPLSDPYLVLSPPPKSNFFVEEVSLFFSLSMLQLRFGRFDTRAALGE